MQLPLFLLNATVNIDHSISSRTGITNILKQGPWTLSLCSNLLRHEAIFMRTCAPWTCINGSWIPMTKESSKVVDTYHLTCWRFKASPSHPNAWTINRIPQEKCYHDVPYQEATAMGIASHGPCQRWGRLSLGGHKAHGSPCRTDGCLLDGLPGARDVWPYPGVLLLHQRRQERKM